MNITHVCVVGSHGKWEPVIFVVTNGKEYFLGATDQSLSENEIEAMVSSGKLKKIKNPLPWNNRLAVWINSGNYLLASKRNPVDDPQSVLLEL